MGAHIGRRGSNRRFPLASLLFRTDLLLSHHCKPVGAVDVGVEISPTLGRQCRLQIPHSTAHDIRFLSLKFLDFRPVRHAALDE